ncbi:hypothetical protein BDY19DRAFT_450512 [Irpex rosettiformis]|uniref:Uncharacterized protein n=1 Tax=Irpex rosettiformis TaxID=378272 RepID=A0ACB8TTJ6_9APHY|nr:hypothetical protein BDY19DRAFT_450512 [Irpex rosettiformis]
MVESTGSLYVMSPDRYPLVVFGDTNSFDDSDYGVGRSAGQLIDSPPKTFNHGRSSSHSSSDSGDRNYDLPSSIDSITRFMKPRKMKSSRLGRPLDGAPSVPLPPSIAQPGLKHEAAVGGNSSIRPGGGIGVLNINGRALFFLDLI